MKKGDNLYQIGKQRERNEHKTGASNSDTSRTLEHEKNTTRESIMYRKHDGTRFSYPAHFLFIRFDLKATHG